MGSPTAREGNLGDFSFQEKCREEPAWRRQETIKTVPQTDTGGLGE